MEAEGDHGLRGKRQADGRGKDIVKEVSGLLVWAESVGGSGGGRATERPGCSGCSGGEHGPNGETGNDVPE